jgi:hypothetical protein
VSSVGSPSSPSGLRRARFDFVYLRGCATRSRRRSVVGLGRLELPTSRLSSARSNQLSYKPLTTRGRTCTHICSDAAQRSPWRVFVREERETKTAASRLWSSTDLAICWPLNVSEEIREIASSEDEAIVPRIILRKEVIQPQVPLRLPCYDFTPVADPTVAGCLHCWLAHRLQVKPTPMV